MRKLQISDQPDASSAALKNNVNTNNNNHNNSQQSSKNVKLSKNNNSVQKRNNHQSPSTHTLNNNRRSRFNPHSDSFVYQQYGNDSEFDDCGNGINSAVIRDEYSLHRLSSASILFDADDERDHDNTMCAPTAHQQQQYAVCDKRRVRSKRSSPSLQRPTTDFLSETQLPHESNTRPYVKSGRRQHAAAVVNETIVFTDNQIYVSLDDDHNANDSVGDIDNDNDDDATAIVMHNNINNLFSTANIASVNKLTDKCPFHISSQLQDQQRRIAYADNRHNLNGGIQPSTATTNDVTAQPLEIFQKVKYDPTKRYLQQASPSNSNCSSVGDCYIPAAHSYEAFLNDQCTQARTSSMYVDDQLLGSTFVQYWPFGREPVTVAAASAKLRQQQRESQLHRQHEQQRQHEHKQHHQQQCQQQQQRAWNRAYEQDDGYVHHNSVLDNHRNRIRMDVGNASPSLSSGSGPSSIDTAETWLEDEAFDNSLNEELEHRCEQTFRKLRSTGQPITRRVAVFAQ